MQIRCRVVVFSDAAFFRRRRAFNFRFPSDFLQIGFDSKGKLMGA